MASGRLGTYRNDKAILIHYKKDMYWIAIGTRNKGLTASFRVLYERLIFQNLTYRNVVRQSSHKRGRRPLRWGRHLQKVKEG